MGLKSHIKAAHPSGKRGRKKDKGPLNPFRKSTGGPLLKYKLVECHLCDEKLRKDDVNNHLKTVHNIHNATFDAISEQIKSVEEPSKVLPKPLKKETTPEPENSSKESASEETDIDAESLDALLAPLLDPPSSPEPEPELPSPEQNRQVGGPPLADASPT